MGMMPNQLTVLVQHMLVTILLWQQSSPTCIFLSYGIRHDNPPELELSH
jgi:hypothetical protein